MRRTSRLLLAATSLGLLCAGAQAAKSDALPIPERRPAGGWVDAQRSLYLNTPLLRRAEEALRKNNAAEAEPLLRQALANDPGSNRARILLAEACGRLGKWQESAQLGEELVRLYPDYLDAHRRLGQALGQLGRTERAVAIYESLLRKAPSDYPGRRPVVRQLAQWLQSLNRHEQAATYGRVWAGFQGDSEPLQFLAECATQRRDWTGTVDFCERLLRLPIDAPLRGGVLLQKGQALSRLNRIPEADAALREAETLLAAPAPRRAILRQLGDNALQEKRAAEAARCFKRCLLEEHDPAVARAYLDALAQSGQWELAAVEAHALLARPDLSAAERDAAEQALRRARQMTGAAAAPPAALAPPKDRPAPRTPPKPDQEAAAAMDAPPSPPFPVDLALARLESLTGLGVAAFRAGQFASAADDFSRALQLTPRRTGLYYLRGMALLKQRQFQQAEADFLRFSQLTERAGTPPSTLWRELGLSEGDQRAFDLELEPKSPPRNDAPSPTPASPPP